jgi:Uncharacterized protein, putative amidase
MNKQVDLSISNYGTVKDTKYDLVILPWGATEPHNYHLPYLTDSFLSHDISVEAAILAKKQYNINCMVLPTINLGSQNPGQRDLKFCLHVRCETQKAILTDIVSSLYLQGFRRMLLINSHGGNSFKNMVRDLAAEYPEFIIAVSDTFNVLPKDDYFEEEGEHADEFETSVIMHYHPELINLDEAGEGKWKPFAIQSVNEKVAWIPRNWQKISEDTGVGNPKKATAAKGKRFAYDLVEKYVKLFYELAKGDIY